ncbi:MAG: hypothetical protein WD825_09610 [Gemmatimonadaceae bacterium]
MAERLKYEQWLDDLEAKKDSTPVKVFDRVRQDYLVRLQAVVAQLGEHTATLQEHAANLVAKLRELEAAEQAHTEEQAEAQLRKQVGEITAAEWESSSKKSQRELAKIKENQDVIADELNSIRGLLGGDDDDRTAGSAPRTSADFNELEFLSSVVGSSTPTGVDALGRKSRAGPLAVSEKSPEAKTSAAPPKPPEAAPSAPAAASAGATPAPPTPAPPRAPVAKKDTPLKTPAVGDSPSEVRTSGVVEQPKTLKCAECGAMNYPSEWYCERCGAEMTIV